MTFGPSSSLERVGVGWIQGTSVEDVSVPDSVRELCEGCFKGCKSLRRVTFGPASSFERIGVSCIEFTGVEEVRLPGRGRVLRNRCFSWHKRLLNALI